MRSRYKEHIFSYETALSELNRYRWFTVRNAFLIRRPGEEPFYRYSAVGKRGNYRDLFRIQEHPVIGSLLRLGEEFPDVSLVKVTDSSVEPHVGQVGTGFLFFVTLTVDAGLFSLDTWNGGRGMDALDDFKKRLIPFIRCYVGEKVSVQFARVTEASQSGLLHFHVFVFVSSGLPVHRVHARYKDSSGAWRFRFDAQNNPVYVWRIGMDSADVLKDEIARLWLADAPTSNFVDVWAVPSLHDFCHYALKYQFKLFSEDSEACRRKDLTVSTLELFNLRGYSFPKSFGSSVFSLISSMVGKELRLDTYTSYLRHEKSDGFFDSLPDGSEYLWLGGFSDSALRSAGFDTAHLGKIAFNSTVPPPRRSDKAYFGRFKYTERSPVTVEGLFRKYPLVSFEEFQRLLSSGVSVMAVDVETTGLDMFSESLVGIGVSVVGGSFYFPVGHAVGENFSLEEVASVLGSVLRDSSVIKVFHNAAFDVSVLARHGFEVENVYDTMIAAYSWDSSKAFIKLNTLASSLLFVPSTSSYDGMLKHEGVDSLADVSVERVARYCCEDTVLSLELFFFFDGLFSSSLSSPGVCATLELNLRLFYPDLCMQVIGIGYDKERALAFSRSLDLMISKVKADIFAAAGKEFNVNSPSQVRVLLFDELKLHESPSSDEARSELSRVLLLKRSRKSGRFSTDADVLKLLSDFHVLPALILQYKYLVGLQRSVAGHIALVEDDGRVHPSFNMIAVTGRLSARKPNLQAVPKARDELHPEAALVRGLFVPAAGRVLVCADYSQMELRMAAILSQDMALCEAFGSSVDTHRKTASLLFGKPLEAVTKAERFIGKTCNFSLLYGRGAQAFRLDYNLEPSHKECKISLEEAQRWIDVFFTEYSGLVPFFDACTRFVDDVGFSETVFGARRWFDDLRGFEYGQDSAKMRREIRSFVVQGACATLTKRAMVAVYEEFLAQGLEARLVLSIHDELVVDCPVEERSVVISILRRCMEDAGFPEVPCKFPVEVKVCLAWGVPLPDVPEVSAYG